ncbi:hypothetical protein [Bradyrhizobium retamae]|nr:hypothetical protein [Bradyrhizobium retamae]
MARSMVVRTALATPAAQVMMAVVVATGAVAAAAAGIEKFARLQA